MQGFRFALLAVAVFNTVIAVLLTLVGYGGSFRDNLVFSHCIGLSVLLLVHLRLARPVARAQKPPRCRSSASSPARWSAGWLGGSVIASLLLGVPWTAGRSAWAALAVTVAAGRRRDLVLLEPPPRRRDGAPADRSAAEDAAGADRAAFPVQHARQPRCADPDRPASARARCSGT